MSVLGNVEYDLFDLFCSMQLFYLYQCVIICLYSLTYSARLHHLWSYLFFANVDEMHECFAYRLNTLTTVTSKIGLRCSIITHLILIRHKQTWWEYLLHDDVIKREHFPRYWPFVGELHKGQWRGALMVFFYLRLNKRSKQSWGWWFETLSCPLWRQCNVLSVLYGFPIWGLQA